MKKKRPAIEKAQEEYLKIVQLQPTPPPRWVIAAGSQVGGLWGNFVREFRAAPIPTDIKKDTELRNTYYGALDEASEPDKLRAKAAFETCLKYSVTYQFFDEYSRKCELWLSKTYKNEYHAVDEFRASPNNVGSGLNDRPYPLRDRRRVYNEAPASPPLRPSRRARARAMDEDKADKRRQEGRRRRRAAPQEEQGGALPGAKRRMTDRKAEEQCHETKRYSMRACSVLLLVAGCGGGEEAQSEDAGKGKRGEKSGREAGRSRSARRDQRRAPSDGRPRQGQRLDRRRLHAIAKQFLDAATKQKSEMKHDFPEALYNAGLAYQRCNKDAEAKAQFQAALDIDPKFHHARVQLALYELKEKGDAAIEPVIAAAHAGRVDAQFQNVEALVNLAMLQMKRRATNADKTAPNDFDRAKKNLQRALAIDDGYLPAFNQLALYYLELAKQKAGRARSARRATFAKTQEGRPQQLELAALVCSQAIRKNPNYAADPQHRRPHPGRAQNINSAVQEFQTAAQARPDVLRSADELRRREPLVPRLQGGRGRVPRGAQDSPERLRRAPRPGARDPRADRRLELRQARRRGRRPSSSSARSSRRSAPRPSTTRRSSRRSTRPRGRRRTRSDARAGGDDLRQLRREGRRGAGVRRRGEARQGSRAGRPRHGEVHQGRPDRGGHRGRQAREGAEAAPAERKGTAPPAEGTERPGPAAQAWQAAPAPGSCAPGAPKTVELPRVACG